MLFYRVWTSEKISFFFLKNRNYRNRADFFIVGQEKTEFSDYEINDFYWFFNLLFCICLTVAVLFFFCMHFFLEKLCRWFIWLPEQWQDFHFFFLFARVRFRNFAWNDTNEIANCVIYSINVAHNFKMENPLFRICFSKIKTGNETDFPI